MSDSPWNVTVDENPPDDKYVVGMYFSIDNCSSPEIRGAMIVVMDKAGCWFQDEDPIDAPTLWAELPQLPIIRVKVEIV